MDEYKGGNAVAVITQRFIKERISPMPKIQVLIYPWIQTFNFRLPSVINYGNIGILAGLLSTSNVVSWYLGLPRGTPELAQSMDSNDHVALIEDQSLVEKFKSYFDLDNIPKEYKEGRTYYEISEANIFPSQLGENHVLKKNKTLAELFKKLYDPGLSPFLADDEILIHSPVSYFIVIERDALKDEAILFSERLRKLGVHVKLAFYSTGAFHGMGKSSSLSCLKHSVLISVKNVSSASDRSNTRLSDLTGHAERSDRIHEITCLIS